ncbi:MAG TPA: glycosyl hydrolase family 18 protein [Bacillota bacterium]|nr:glycosyl hydrolase family 18 protein [Bacillota bacterium]
MMKVIALFLLLLTALFGCSSGGLRTINPDPPAQSNPKLYLAGWLAGYDTTRGQESFLTNIALFNEINPVWYNFNPVYFTPGAAPFVTNIRNKEIILSNARNNRVKVLPTVQNFGTTTFDPVGISRVLNNPELRANHVQEILKIVMDEGYDGIDIDYESLPAGDRQVFTAFINELSDALRRHDKLLSVTIYAKTSNNANWEGPGPQDWGAIARKADNVKIMAYDYHWLTFHAGPITPQDWLRDVLKYAETIPEIRGKLIVGLPLYGLNWGTAGTPAKEVMYQDAQKLLARTSGGVSRASLDHSADQICGHYNENVEPYFKYVESGVNRTVFFQDAQALQQRLSLISEYLHVVKGITFWRLGGEDPEVWPLLRRF